MHELREKPTGEGGFLTEVDGWRGRRKAAAADRRMKRE